MRLVRRLCLATAATAVLIGAGTGTAYAEDCLAVTDAAAVTEPADGPSKTFADLDMKRALDLAERRGGNTPVHVAVVGSGIAATSGRVVEVAQTAEWTPPVQGSADPLSTVIAGLIAGPDAGKQPIGFAPFVGLVDVRAFQTSFRNSEVQLPNNAARLAAGLEAAAAAARADRALRIVTVATPVAFESPEDNDRLRAAVDSLVNQGVIVVAASGDRPSGEDSLLYDDFKPPADGDPRVHGEDAAGFSFPAGFPNVLAVTTTAAEPGGDPSAIALPNSQIDVAVPTAGAVAYAANGTTCTIDNPSTSFAAAEVSGILAVLMRAFPNDNAAQLVARLKGTATGSATRTNPLTGHGIVQPVEAILRPLAPAKDGNVDRSESNDKITQAGVPQDPEDVLAETREKAVWWGLIGGGALIIAIMLRPVLARRRR